MLLPMPFLFLGGGSQDSYSLLGGGDSGWVDAAKFLTGAPRPLPALFWRTHRHHANAAGRVLRPRATHSAVLCCAMQAFLRLARLASRWCLRTRT